MIERVGPTGLIVTTTAARLHSENETRLISVTISDTREQTAAVLKAQAARREKESGGLGDRNDLAPWRALQVYLASGTAKVTIPFAEALADLVRPVAVRLRRDFPTMLTLIEAHALLHQASRDVTLHGAVIATLDDYRAVRELIAELIADGVGATVSKTVCETVETVRKLTSGGMQQLLSAL
jgi:hypothetical protein